MDSKKEQLRVDTLVPFVTNDLSRMIGKKMNWRISRAAPVISEIEGTSKDFKSFPHHFRVSLVAQVTQVNVEVKENVSGSNWSRSFSFNQKPFANSTELQSLAKKISERIEVEISSHIRR